MKILFIGGTGNISTSVSSLAVELLKGYTWDAVVNWIAFTPKDVKRDFRLFSGKTRQYIFISSASCYQKQADTPLITESTPLHNPLWDYSMQKIFDY